MQTVTIFIVYNQESEEFEITDSQGDLEPTTAETTEEAQEAAALRKAHYEGYQQEARIVTRRR